VVATPYQGTLIPTVIIIVQWTHSFRFVASPAPKIIPCVPVADGTVKAWLDFLFIAVFDCNVAVLTLLKALSQWREGVTRARLVQTLYRDGVMYFTVLSVISITNVALLKIKHDTVYFDFMVLLQRVFHAILSSRIIINVRKALRTPTDQATTIDPLATATFGTQSSRRTRKRAVLFNSASQEDRESETFEINATDYSGDLDRKYDVEVQRSHR